MSERLGHSSVSFTLDVYSHAVPALQADAADTIADLLSGDGDDEDDEPDPPTDDASQSSDPDDET